jgi:hypothetical protein
MIWRQKSDDERPVERRGEIQAITGKQWYWAILAENLYYCLPAKNTKTSKYGDDDY